MPINLTVLLHCGKEAAAGQATVEAVREAFPAAATRVVESLQAALAGPPAVGTELLVLASPSPDDLACAVEAMDESKLPRWAVVVLGPGVRPNEVGVPPEDWHPRSLAQALHLALAQHALKRENARARGDLKTIGRRFIHDLRAQVGGIITTAEAAREAQGDRPGAPPLQSVIDSTDGLMRLIDRVSFVVRASADARPGEPIDMGLTSWAALQRLETQILNQRATLVQSSSWPAVQGVAAWTEVVWWNLLVNALQHGGKSPRIETGWNQDGRQVRFWIQDDGRGVPGEKRDLLFHPFHLLHEPNAPNGLGLPIVRRLVELQGGHCGYEPVEGKPRFFFTLPAS